MTAEAIGPYIFDASALIAYCKHETGGDMVADILLRAKDRCFAHAVNICELYYKVLSAAGEEPATAALNDLDRDGLIVREDLDREFLLTVGHHKVDRPTRPPIADCFCMALADRIDGEIVTADHPDFDRLAASGACRVRFIR